MSHIDLELKKQRIRAYRQKQYLKNKDAILARNNERRRRLSSKMAEYKSKLFCIKCGQNHPATLDFHHIEKKPGDKKVNILLKDGNTWERIEAEMNKCLVLCANCHRIHHHDERVEKASEKLAKSKKGSNIKKTG